MKKVAGGGIVREGGGYCAVLDEDEDTIRVEGYTYLSGVYSTFEEAEACANRNGVSAKIIKII